MRSLPDKLRFIQVNEEWYSIPWEDLAIGCSFFLPSLVPAHFFASRLRYGASHFGVKLEAHARVERGVLGVRVWRTA